MSNTNQASVNMITVNGKTLSAYKWAKELGYKNKSYFSLMLREKGTEATIAFIEKKIKEGFPQQKQPKLVTINGVTHKIKEWAAITGCSYSYAVNLYNKKGEVAAEEYIKNFNTKENHRAKSAPVMITVNNETHNLGQWANILGLSRSSVSSVYNKKGEDALVKYINNKLNNKSSSAPSISNITLTPVEGFSLIRKGVK